jgi:hypothetical protein
MSVVIIVSNVVIFFRWFLYVIVYTNEKVSEGGCIVQYIVNEMFHLTKKTNNKMKKNLHTSFIKFLLEKYAKPDEPQRLPEEEPEEELNQKEKLRKIKELDGEDEPLPVDDEGVEDEIQELLNEYKKLKRRNENNRVYNRRRR